MSSSSSSSSGSQTQQGLSLQPEVIRIALDAGRVCDILSPRILALADVTDLPDAAGADASGDRHHGRGFAPLLAVDDEIHLAKKRHFAIARDGDVDRTDVREVAIGAGSFPLECSFELKGGQGHTHLHILRVHARPMDRGPQHLHAAAAAGGVMVRR